MNRPPRARQALWLVAGVALVSGFAAGRRQDRTVRVDADPTAGPVHAAPATAVRVAGNDHRLHPDVLLGPVLLVMTGIIVDRLRESEAREAVTAWMLISGTVIAGLLARSAGYRWAARGFYCFLVCFSWGASALYVKAGQGALPQSWVSSTLTVSLLWFGADLREGLRGAGRGHRLRAALAAGRRWCTFVLAWAVVAPLTYLYVGRALTQPVRPWWLWPSVVVVLVLGGAAIAALTLPGPSGLRRPRRRPGRRG